MNTNSIFSPLKSVANLCNKNAGVIGAVGLLVVFVSGLSWLINLNYKIDNLENKIISRIESEITDEIIVRIEALEKAVGELKNKNTIWGEEAVLFYIKQALRGDIIAEYRLGLLYHYGSPSIGIEQNYEEAFDYYMRAAESGVPEAQYSLGLFYQNGLGGNDKNEEEAERWFDEAKKNGFGK